MKRLKKTTTTTKNKPKILQKSMTNSCLWSHCDWWLEEHWKSAFADWTKKIEGWRSGKSRKTEAKKKIQDLNGVGWSVLGAVTTFGISGVSILYNLHMVVSYLFQISNQWYKKLSFLQYKDNSYGHLPIKNTRRHMGVTLLQGLSPPPHTARLYMQHFSNNRLIFFAEWVWEANRHAYDGTL